MVRVVVRAVLGLVVGAIVGGLSPLVFCVVCEAISPGSIGPAATAFAIMMPFTCLLGAGAGAVGWPLFFYALEDRKEDLANERIESKANHMHH